MNQTVIFNFPPDLAGDIRLDVWIFFFFFACGVGSTILIYKSRLNKNSRKPPVSPLVIVICSLIFFLWPAGILFSLHTKLKLKQEYDAGIMPVIGKISQIKQNFVQDKYSNYSYISLNLNGQKINLVYLHHPESYLKRLYEGMCVKAWYFHYHYIADAGDMLYRLEESNDCVE